MEKIKLTVEIASTGIRYRKMFKGKTWTSKVFPADSRRNKAEAWSAFCAWRDDQKAEMEAEQKAEIEADPYRKNLVGKIDQLRQFAESIGDDSGRRQYAYAATLAATGDRKALEEITEILKLDDNQDRLFFDVAKTVNKATEKNRQPDADLNCSDLIDGFLSRYKRKAANGRGSFGQYGLSRAALNRFGEFFGFSKSLATISEQTVATYAEHLESQVDRGEISSSTASQYQKIFRTFVAAMAEDYDVPLPKNLRSKRLTITAERTEPKPFTVDEVRLFLENASERTELYLLLMLNCGMYQGDIADLQGTEIDWKHGRIIRPRSKAAKLAKTTGKKTAVKVNWLLWDRTFELLKKYGHQDGHALRNSKGLPLVQHSLNGEQERRNDNCRSAFDRVAKKLKNRGLLRSDWQKSMKQLRKTGANLLEKSDHAEFYELYLDHSTVARRHYLTSGEPVPKFDAAVRWLGSQFDLKTTRQK